ncbi:hypothetical protein C8J56DRAFT_887183 [Mycena floridula]|nr:hypothetical protein C8J56DRAFT_887183 [Mycena floridula]
MGDKEKGLKIALPAWSHTSRDEKKLGPGDKGKASDVSKKRADSAYQASVDATLAEIAEVSRIELSRSRKLDMRPVETNDSSTQPVPGPITGRRKRPRRMGFDFQVKQNHVDGGPGGSGKQDVKPMDIDDSSGPTCPRLNAEREIKVAPRTKAIPVTMTLNRRRQEVTNHEVSEQYGENDAPIPLTGILCPDMMERRESSITRVV